MMRVVFALFLLGASIVASYGSDYDKPPVANGWVPESVFYGPARGAPEAALAPLYSEANGAVARIKDIVSVVGVRDNQLVGYGLVVGLAGTGDSLRNSPFTDQSLQSMLDRLGVNIRQAQARTNNIAAVIVTANLPPFAGRGSRIDVTVSSLGDAKSLAGGSLVLTPLLGADKQIYAVAQGAVTVSGFKVTGQAETVTQNVPTSARIPNGALVEREPPSRFGEDLYLTLELRNPDFATAVRVADAINAYSQLRYGIRPAEERDLRTITLRKPRRVGATRFLAEVGSLPVHTDTPARVVLDERTGTVVIGSDVRISTVAVSHGNLIVRVTETPLALQPLPFSEGETVILPQTQVDVEQAGDKVSILRGADLQMLVNGLNKMGLKPPDIIAILQAIESAGALQAHLVVQ